MWMNKRLCASEASRCKLEWDTGVEQAHWQSSKNGRIPHGSSADHLEPAQPFNRPAGDAGAHRLRTALGLQPQRRGLSRPDTSTRRSDYPEPRRQPRGDGAADRHPDRDRAQWDARPEIPAEHLAGWAQRRQVNQRTELVHVTTHNVLHNLLVGMGLVITILFVFLGDLASA